MQRSITTSKTGKATPCGQCASASRCSRADPRSHQCASDALNKTDHNRTTTLLRLPTNTLQIRRSVGKALDQGPILLFWVAIIVETRGDELSSSSQGRLSSCRRQRTLFRPEGQCRAIPFCFLLSGSLSSPPKACGRRETLARARRRPRSIPRRSPS